MSYAPSVFSNGINYKVPEQYLFSEKKDKIIQEDDKYTFKSEIENVKGIYKTDKKSGVIEKVTSSYGYIVAITNNWIYFTKLHPSYEMPKIYQPTGLYGANKDDSNDWIYFTKLYNSYEMSKIYQPIGLYRVKKDGLKEECVTNDKAEIFYFDENYMYFFKEKHNLRKLYVITDDNKNKYQIQEVSSTSKQLVRITHEGHNETEVWEDSAGDAFTLNNNNLYHYKSEDNTLVRIDIDSKSNICLADNVSIEEIKVAGDFVYYTDLNDGGSIYSVKMDGTQRVKLTNNYARHIEVHGDYIYYINCSDEYNLYQVSIDGAKCQLIHRQNMSIQVRERIEAAVKTLKKETGYKPASDHYWKGNILYYKGCRYYINTKDCNIYKTDPLNSKIQKIVSEPVAGFEIINDWLYYSIASLDKSGSKDDVPATAIPKGGLYKIRLDGKVKVYINSDRAYKLYINNNFLLYSIHGDEDVLYLLDKDRNAARRLSHSNISTIYVYKSKVYFLSAEDDKHSIYTTNSNGLDKKIIETIDKKIIDFYINNDWIYVLCYCKESKEEIACKLRLDGTDYQVIKRIEYFKGLQE